jgi:hypothetical protein
MRLCSFFVLSRLPVVPAAMAYEPRRPQDHLPGWHCGQITYCYASLTFPLPLLLLLLLLLPAAVVYEGSLPGWQCGLVAPKKARVVLQEREANEKFFQALAGERSGCCCWSSVLSIIRHAASCRADFMLHAAFDDLCVV